MEERIDRGVVMKGGLEDNWDVRRRETRRVGEKRYV
jgi:hypothetical protein